MILSICARSHKNLTRLLTTRLFSSLRDAEILYSDNHVLVVDKPPGWHSMPNQEDADNSKCLVTHLRKRKLGGGSNKRFLTPLHRIDQPCSGVLMLGKTTRAAKRIQPEWAMVRKTYCVVVSPTASASWDLMRLAVSESKAWRRLKGTMLGKKNITKTTKGWSVAMEPGAVSRKGRTVQLDWSLVGTESDQPDDSSFVLLIRTHQGSRHMVRAVLACNGLPIQGDSRYGGKSTHLPFVALHARSLLLPSFLSLGSLEQRLFTAPLPLEWRNHIHIREEILAQTENESVSFPYLLD